MNFVEFLYLVENQTVSQYLQGVANDNFRASKIQIQNFLKTQTNFLNPKQQSLISNWLLFHNLPNTDQLGMWGAIINAGAVQPLWPQIKDFVIANLNNNQAMSKFNNTAYTPEMAIQDSKDWHERIAQKRRGPGAEGETILDLASIGWSGWKWVSLGRGSCSQEGKAAGHCGNAGAKEGDNIISLRDKNNYVHLTFIVNNGVLGESKGTGNSKPSPKYHDPIVALLRTNHIKTIKGAGYLPQNNFKFTDLTPELQADLKAMKPDLPNYVDYVFKPPITLKKLNNLFNFKFKSLDKNVVVINTTDDYKDLYDQINTGNSKVEDFSWMEEPWEHFSNYDYDNGIQNAIEFLDRKEIDAIEKYLDDKYSEEYEDWQDYDLQNKIEIDDEVEQALRNAMQSGTESGLETAALNHLYKELGHPTDIGFYVDFSQHPYKICIGLEALKDFYPTAENDIEKGENFDYFYDFKYKPPYYGYDGFSKEEFRHRLEEDLPFDLDTSTNLSQK